MHVRTLILGAGAAGLMAAAYAGPDTLVIDHARAPGEKIRISGGGRCNFTNMHTSPDRFISQNPHFAKSALSRYTQWDFIALVDAHGIAHHEKTLGQLFCDGSAKQIVQMLLTEANRAGAKIWLETSVGGVRHDGTFHVILTRQGRDTDVTADNLIVLFLLFVVQKRGTGGIGRFFGPITLVWFLTIAALGVAQIVAQDGRDRSGLPRGGPVRTAADNAAPRSGALSLYR